MLLQTVNSGASVDVSVLRSLYLSMGGPVWKNSSNWPTAQTTAASAGTTVSANACNWFGVRCDDSSRVVYVLVFAFPSMHPSLCIFLAVDACFCFGEPYVRVLFFYLRVRTPPLLLLFSSLDLSGNNLTGTIPTSVSLLTTLTYVFARLLACLPICFLHVHYWRCLLLLGLFRSSRAAL